MPVPASASSMVGEPSPGLGPNTDATAAAMARWPSRVSDPAPVSLSSFACAAAGGTEIVRGGGRSAASSHWAKREKSIRSPASGRSRRAETSGAQLQPSRARVAFAVHAPSRSRQSGAAIVASSLAAIAGSKAAALASVSGGVSPSVRLSPAIVGTAKRAG